MTPSHRLLVLSLCTLLLTSTAARAQSGEERWEVEVHGGGMVSQSGTGGSGLLPGPTSTFTASSGRTSRRVSSWFFGDGAQLLSQVSTQLGAGSGITPLEIDADSVAAIEASRAAFVATWNGVIDSGPFSDATVGSTQTIRASERHQTFATGTLNVNMRTEGTVIPYVAGGSRCGLGYR